MSRSRAVRESVDFHVSEQDLSGLPAVEREREVGRLAVEDAWKPFDLTRDLLLRVSLLTLSDEEHVALFNMHHIASDGWSMGVLLRELRALYEAYRAGEENPLQPLVVQYADYASWQRQWLRGEALEGQLSYWRSRLSGLPLLHNLPLDKPRPAQQGFEGGHHIQRVSRELKDRLEACGREHRATLFMVLQAAFSVLLHRYSGETDIVMGSPIAGRVHRDLEPLIGFFINTLVLRDDLSDNPRFLDLLEASRQTILDAYAHQHAPFEMLVQELRPERSLSHHPLFQILIVLQSAEREDEDLGGARLKWLGGSRGIVKFDLELNVQELADGLAVNWVYKEELFHDATIERMAASFGVLLAGIVETAGREGSGAALVPEPELCGWPAAWRPARFGIPAGAPHPRAVRGAGGTIAGSRGGGAGRRQADLPRVERRRANRLARGLIAQGVGPESWSVSAWSLRWR